MLQLLFIICLNSCDIILTQIVHRKKNVKSNFLLMAQKHALRIVTGTKLD